MSEVKLNKKEIQQIDEAVAHFNGHRKSFDDLARGLMSKLRKNPDLSPYIHFIKHRIKDPNSLRKKLERKNIERKTKAQPCIGCKNLFTEITDLAGIRIIHLRADQIEKIHEIIISTLKNKNLC